MPRWASPLQFQSVNPALPPPGSRQVGRLNKTDLYVYTWQWAPPPAPKKAPDPTPAYQSFEKGQLQARINTEFLVDETAKMAAGAQMRLQADVDAIEAANATTRERNARLVEALRRVSGGRDFGQDREGWLRWWVERRGYTYTPPRDQPRPTLDVQIPLPYAPRSGPAIITEGGGGGGDDRGWCLILDIEKGKPPIKGQCFAAGTSVLTLEGPRAIESLRPGDPILVGDGPGPALRAGSVREVYRGESPRTVRLAIGGETILATPGHPFWKVGAGWTRAGDFAIGDEVETIGGPALVEATQLQGAAPTWNLTVEGGSTYLVGRLGVVVHDAQARIGLTTWPWTLVSRRWMPLW